MNSLKTVYFICLNEKITGVQLHWLLFSFTFFFFTPVVRQMQKCLKPVKTQLCPAEVHQQSFPAVKLLPFNFASFTCFTNLPPCQFLQRRHPRSPPGFVAQNRMIWLLGFSHQQVEETRGVSDKPWVTRCNDAAFCMGLCAARGLQLLRPVSAFLLHLWEAVQPAGKQRTGWKEVWHEVRKETD